MISVPSGSASASQSAFAPNGFVRRARTEKSDHRHRLLLRARRGRPCRAAADKSNNPGVFYSFRRLQTLTAENPPLKRALARLAFLPRCQTVPPPFPQTKRPSRVGGPSHHCVGSTSITSHASTGNYRFCPPLTLSHRE